MNKALIKKVFKLSFKTFKENKILMISQSIFASGLLLITIIAAIIAAFILPENFSQRFHHVAEAVMTALIYHIIPFMCSLIFMLLSCGFMKICKGEKSAGIRAYIPSLKTILRYFLFALFVIFTFVIITMAIPTLYMFFKWIYMPESMKTVFMYFSGKPMFLAGILSFVALFLFFLRYFFTFFAILDNLKLKDAIKRSSEITKNYTTEILIIFIIIYLINMLGLSMIIIGFFISLPISILALIYTYYELLYLYSDRDKIKENV